MTRRIAIADDDTDFRTLLARYLRRCGFEVIEAADGVELARRVVEACADGRRPHVVVTDVNMPRLDGLTLTSRLRALYEDIPVVLMTALPDHPVRQAEHDQEHVYLLVKPFAPEALVKLVLGLPEPPRRHSWVAA